MSENELLYIVIALCSFIMVFCLVTLGGVYTVYTNYGPQFNSVISTVNDFQTNYYPQITADFTDFQTNYYPTVLSTLTAIQEDLPQFQTLMSELQVIVPQINNAIPQIQSLLSQAPSIQANIATIANAANKLQSFGF